VNLALTARIVFFRSIFLFYFVALKKTQKLLNKKMRNRQLRREHWSSSQAAAFRQLKNISAFAFAELENIHFKHYIILTTSTSIDNDYNLK